MDGWMYRWMDEWVMWMGAMDGMVNGWMDG